LFYFHYDGNQTNIVLKLAMKCTDQSPSLRPPMSQVVAVLEGEKTLEDISEEIAPSISPAWVPDGQYIYRVFCHVSISIDSSFFLFFIGLFPLILLSMKNMYWFLRIMALEIRTSLILRDIYIYCFMFSIIITTLFMFSFHLSRSSLQLPSYLCF